MAFWKRWFGQTRSQPSLSNGPPAGQSPEDVLGFPLVTGSGAEALELHGELARSHPGVTPVILGDNESIELMLESFEERLPPDETLAAAQKIDAKQWFLDRRSMDAEYYDSVEEGVWPEEAGGLDTILSVSELSGRPRKRVYIGLVPTAENAAVFGHLQYGGWNECPLAEEHIAVARYWHSTRGAEVISASSDIVEYRVARPPTTREDAMALALEHFTYCSDCIYQGHDTLSALAAVLMKSRYWYFWWD